MRGDEAANGAGNGHVSWFAPRVQGSPTGHQVRRCWRTVCPACAGMDRSIFGPVPEMGMVYGATIDAAALPPTRGAPGLASEPVVHLDRFTAMAAMAKGAVVAGVKPGTPRTDRLDVVHVARPAITPGRLAGRVLAQLRGTRRPPFGGGVKRVARHPCANPARAVHYANSL